MWKEAMIVAAAAAVGTYADQKWGAALEAKAVQYKVPPAIAHAAAVGTFTGVAYFIAKQVL